MRPVAALLLAAAAAPAFAGERAFLELETGRETYFVQEPIRVRLRFGFDAAYFRDHAVQPYRQALDVPVKVQAPWLAELPGTLPLASADAEEGRLTFVLNDRKARGTQVRDVVRDGRTYTVLEVERRFLPHRAGRLELSAPLLRFAYATRFDEDFIDGRVPLDRRDAVVHGAPVTVQVRELPRAGRPSAFTGAVGRFSVVADADPRAVAAGESLKLVLRIEGDGNFGFFDPPRLEDLPGFHVYGSVEQSGAVERPARHTVTYDLAPTDSDVTSVPPIAFAYFDTSARPAAYRIVRTRAIPLEVRGAPVEPPLPESPAPPGTASVDPGSEDGLWAAPAAAGVLLLAAFAGVVFLLRRRARARAAVDPDDVRAEAACAAFTGDLAAGNDVTDAFVAYLAARLRCAPAAVIAPELRARLASSAVPDALAARTAELVETLVAARYGGDVPDDARTSVVSLATELEAVFSRR